MGDGVRDGKNFIQKGFAMSRTGAKEIISELFFIRGFAKTLSYAPLITPSGAGLLGGF